MHASEPVGDVQAGGSPVLKAAAGRPKREWGANLAERRSQPRAIVQFRIKFRSGVFDGRGCLADLSTRGARLEEATVQPQIGAEVELDISLSPLPLFTVKGTVQRRTWNGFAVAFPGDDPELERFVADAAGMI